MRHSSTAASHSPRRSSRQEGTPNAPRVRATVEELKQQVQTLTAENEALKAELAQTKTRREANVVRKSTVENPVGTVRRIVSEMVAANPNVARKEIVAACEAAGVATWTVRTQVGMFLKTARAEAAASTVEK